MILYATVENVNTLLSGKANSSHENTITDITDLQSNLNSKANTVHEHAIESVTGLQTS